MTEGEGLRVGLLDLYDALGQPGCAACRSTRIREERYLRYLVTEYASDATTRDRILSSPGFCARHTWVMTTVEPRHAASPAGAAILLDAILGEWMRRIAPLLAGRAARDALGRREECAACAAVALGTEGELRDLAAALHEGDERIRSRHEASDGLCLEHLGSLLAVAPDSAGRREVVALALRRAGEVRDALREADRKRAWSARDEAPGPERTAWQRAALLVGGAVDELAAPARDAPWPRDARGRDGEARPQA